MQPISPTPQPDGRRDWLASLLLQRPNSFLPRLAVGLARLRALPRGYRRRLQRKAALTAAGAALMLALAGSPLLTPAAHAASITVDETTCTLVDAIRAANTNAVVGGCASGAAGVDTIDLQANVTLTASAGNYYYSDTGLPLVTEDLIIEGNGFTVARDGAAPAFRILAAAQGVALTVNDTTISGGDSQAEGGGIYHAGGNLTIADSTISGNKAAYKGGGIYNDDGDMTITHSVISDNEAGYEGGGIYQDEGGDLIISHSVISGNQSTGDEGGGLYFNGSNSSPINTATITFSRFEDNYAEEEGGAIYHDGGQMTIEDSIITGNEAGEQGGGIYVEYSPLTIRRSTIAGNTAGYEGGGVYTDGALTVEDSTISDNEAGESGGGIHVDDRGSVAITNSSLSGNRAGENGGGIYFDHNYGSNSYGFLDNRIVHTTITGNEAGIDGGGLSLYYDSYHPAYSPVAVLERTIISGNTALSGAGVEIDDGPGNVTADDFNVLGDSGEANAAAFTNFTPGASDITATSDGSDPTPIGGILNTTLAANGGPTQTHLLVDGSPALDTAPDGPATDQRGAARPIGAAYDSGAVEGTQALIGDIYVSTTTAGTTGDGLAFGPEDIIHWDGSAWSTWFDGSAAGLMPFNAKHNINAFWIPDASAGDVVMSFTQNARVVPGIGPKVDGMDLVWWDGAAFSLYFDGSDVGLTQKTNEKIDGLHILPGSMSPIGGSCQAYLLISTQGTGRVTDYNGGTLKFSGEDVLGFCATNLGANTTGFWHMVLDGSAEGMPRNSTDSISFSDDGQTMYLTTKGTFNVDSAVGGHSMVYVYDFGTQTFSGPIFIAADNGLSKTVDGLQVD